MEVIIKNGNKLSLTVIPDDDLKLVKKGNEEVITDFKLSEEEKQKIYNGCKLNLDMTISETPEYLILIENEYKDLRKNAYPDWRDFADAWVKGDEIALGEYRQKCLDVKLKYPKIK